MGTFLLSLHIVTLEMSRSCGSREDLTKLNPSSTKQSNDRKEQVDRRLFL